MFFDSSNFLRPETRFSESTPDEDFNHTSFDGNENFGKRYFENFSTSKPHENEPPTSPIPTDPEEAPEIFNGRELEEFEISFNHNEPLQQEILLIGGRHYNLPPNNTSLPPTQRLPEWVIISSDARIAHLIPLSLNDQQGLIVCRNQAIINEGNLFIDISRNPQLTTSAEIQRGVFDIRTFVGPSRLSEPPHRLFYNDERVRNIVNITKAYLYKKEIHLNLTVNNNNNSIIQNTWNLNYYRINEMNVSQTNNLIKQKSIDLSNHMNNTLVLNNNNNIMNDTPKLNNEANITMQNHLVQPNHETIYSEAYVQSHGINVNHETKTSDAYVVSHEVEPVFAVKTSNPEVESLKVNPKMIEKTVDTNIESVKVNPKEITKEVTTVVESLHAEPKLIEKSVTTNVESLQVKPLHNPKVVETSIESLQAKPNLIEKSIVIPMESIKANPKIIEKTIQNEIESCHVKPLIKKITNIVNIEENEIEFRETKKKVIVEIPVPDIGVRTTKARPGHDKIRVITDSDSDDEEDSSETTSTSNNDSSIIQDIKGRHPESDNHEEEEDPSSESTWEEDMESELIENIKACETKKDIVKLIQKWRRRQNLNIWKHENINIAKQPLVHIMIRENKWITPDQFPCQGFCEETFKTGNALVSHMNKVHGTKPMKNHLYGCIKTLIGKDLIWLIRNETNANDEAVYRDNVFVCLAPNCKYFTCSHKAMCSHIAHKHSKLEESINTIGWFWTSILEYTKVFDEIPSCLDILSMKEGFLCNQCKTVWGSDSKGILNHARKQHGATNIEGYQQIYDRIKCYPTMYMNLEDRREQVDRSLKEYQDLMFNQRNVTENERMIIRETPFITNNEQEINIRERHIREEARRNIYNQNARRMNGNRVVRTEPDENPVVNINIQNLANDFNLDIMSKLNREQLLELARIWTDINNEQESQFVSLPKIWGKNRRKINSRIKNLFKDKIEPLIKICKPLKDRPKDENYYIWEGCLSKINLLIREELRDALKITMNKMLNRTNTVVRGIEEREKAREVETETHNLCKLVAILWKIYDLMHKPNTQTHQNIIVKLQEKVIKTIHFLPDDINNILGINNHQDILNLLDTTMDNLRNKLNFINAKINDNQRITGNRKNDKYKDLVQNIYMEDPRRCIRWYITNNTTPECTIEPQEFVKEYGNNWNKSKILQNTNEFTPEKILNEQDNECLINDLFNKDLIKQAINSRSNISAHGPDGISNVVWKIGGDNTVKMIKYTTRVTIEAKRCPELLKRGKTIMLYKKGNKEDPHSWRPITITPTFYRMWMVVLARAFQNQNMRHPYIERSQKGFMQCSNGTSEHGIMINELIQHVNRKEGSIYITTIDFSDAFGSIPHPLIFKNLEKQGFDQRIIDLIKATYDNTNTRIQVPMKSTSESITINCGVKQGCPFSPIAFNICINALLNRLEKNKVDGFHLNDKIICAQAYADDLVLISDTETGMNNLINIVDKFCDYTNMQIQPNKCRTFNYINHNDRRFSAITNFKIKNNLIPFVNLSGGITYLGITTALLKSTRMKAANYKISKALEDIGNICSSPLKWNQMVDAIKRFILPSLDYAFANGTTSKTDRNLLNRRIRASLNANLKTCALPIDFYYTKWENGGAGLKDVNERHNNLIISSFLKLWFSEDALLRDLFRALCWEEKSYRYKSVGENRDKDIFDDVFDENMMKNNPGTSNLFSRVIHALKESKVVLSLKFKHLPETGEQNEELIPENLEDYITINFPTRDLEFSFDRQLFLQIINFHQADIHYNNLIELPLRGHTFKTLKHSKLSNYFMNQYTSKMSDYLIKFAIQARTNSFYTEQHHRLAHPEDNIGKCGLCGAADSLRHRLNDCRKTMHLMKNRHDAVVREIVEMIKAKPGNKPIIHLDSRIKDSNGQALEGQHRTDKPDIWFIQNNKYTLIEVTVPYGDVNEQNENSLETRFEQKKLKYAELCDDIKKQTGLDVNYYVIVISSLGAWYQKSLDELRTLANSKDLFKRYAKRITVATLKESQILFSNHYVEDASDNSDTSNSSSSTDNESSENSLSSEGSGDDASDEQVSEDIEELYTNLVLQPSETYTSSDDSLNRENGVTCNNSSSPPHTTA